MPPRSYLIFTIPEHPLRRALDMPFPPNPNLLTELHFQSSGIFPPTDPSPALIVPKAKIYGFSAWLEPVAVLYFHLLLFLLANPSYQIGDPIPPYLVREAEPVKRRLALLANEMSYVSGRVVDPQWVWELALRSRLSANPLDQILSERKDANGPSPVSSTSTYLNTIELGHLELFPGKKEPNQPSASRYSYYTKSDALSKRRSAQVFALEPFLKEKYQEVITDLPDEEVLYAKVLFPWEIYFNGASRIDARIDREKAHAAWRGRKPEEEAQAAKAREGASHSKPYKIRHVNRTSPGSGFGKGPINLFDFPSSQAPLNVLLPISIRVELARHCRSDDSTVAGNLLLSKAIGNPFYYYFLCHFEAVSASISFRLLALVVVMLMPFPFLPPVALLPSRKEGFDAKTGFDASRVLEKLCALCECYLY
ncbi:hypothetical protein Salat_2965700 [Sesamum alatum]|uniref:Uncharacterized protein n=1 Tax=Sesamum alatum TaxID=300844 RepID=A0AAE1XIV9_9LAMI|nr:hypothetical protein Salat_2972200 [Sesamum alatum]KAK4412244.1 hypothetical protein Salat_2965700 [Sesamum alatum]